MPIKIRKEEWEEFQKWLKEKEKQKQKTEDAEETLEIEDDLIEEWLEEEKEEKEEYICPRCGYKDTKPFERCPSCSVKLKWE